MYSDAIQAYYRSISKYELLTAEQEVGLANDIEAGLLAQERLEILMLSGDTADSVTMNDLNRLAEIGKSAKEKFINANLRLVVSLAKRYQGRGLDLEELIAEGNLGLIRAVEMYDYKLGNKFSTYATWWIKQSITRALADKGQLIRYPVHIHEKLMKVRREVILYESENSKKASAQDIAASLGYKVEYTKKLLELISKQTVHSLERPLIFNEMDGSVLGDIIVDADSESGYERIDFDLWGREIMDAIDKLEPIEKNVLVKRFGLDGSDALTMVQIGAIYGLKGQIVGQILERAISKLRHPARNLSLNSDNENLDWQEQALCPQTDPGMFYPAKGGSTRNAKKVCSNCTVIEECLAYALDNRERFGIWGGFSERERRALLKLKSEIDLDGNYSDIDSIEEELTQII